MDGQFTHIHSAGGLNGVAVQQYTVRRQHRGDTRHVLNNTDFVIHRHDTNDEHRLVELVPQRIQVDRTFCINGDDPYIEALPTG